METSSPRGPRRVRAVIVALLIGAAYFAAGQLGLLLRVQPGLVSAVWPAAGVALGAVILGRLPAAAGVWLGAFAMEMLLLRGAGAPETALAAVIATGAAAQAALGAWLVHRFVGYSNLLVQEFDVVRILLLGGPVACIIGASVGVAALSYGGLIAREAVWLHGSTWWIGDCIGVLIFTPLVLVWAARPYRLWLQRQLFVSVPLVGLFATVVALFMFVSAREQQRIEGVFHALADGIGQELQKNVNATLTALASLEGFYASSENVQPYEFEIFATRLLRAMPGASAVAWTEVVDGDARARFERRAGAGLRIRELSAGGALVPAAARDEYAVLRYRVPKAGNEIALGYDELSDPVRRAAIEQARDTGTVTATGSVTLVQAHPEPGVLAFMPVYRNGVQPKSIVARRRYVQGYAVAVFEVGALLQGAAQSARANGLVLRAYDDGAAGAPEVLFGQPAPAAAGAPGLEAEYRFSFAGRPWRLSLTLPPEALIAHRSWESWFVLAGGLMLTSLVGMLLLLGVGRAARVEALVETRTSELRRLNADLTEEAARRRRLESEFERRANDLTESNAELQRRAEVNRQLLRSLRHSEGELRRTALQLAASNRELEQFAYVASHDLKAPLRSIGSFAQLLDRRYATALGDEGHEFLRFIHDGIRQMQALIDDLLQLSRVDPRRLEPAPVSMSQIVERACRQLTADLAATHAHVHSGALPDVHADANMLVQLIQNLIANAVKFQKPGNRPEVWIDAEADGDFWHFTVRDNGIGIDPLHLNQIFMVFRRLHTSDQFPGNGIGLAICKKVVTLHGGEIWAESAPGQGTTFHFTLPRRSDVERAAA